MAAVVHVFEPIRPHTHWAAPPDPANRARQSQGLSLGTGTDFQGSSCDDAILISSDEDSDDDLDDSWSDTSFPPMSEIMAPCKAGRHDVNSLTNDEDRLPLSSAAHEINGTHAIVEEPQQASQAANGSSTTEPASSPTYELPGSPSISVRARSNTPAPERPSSPRRHVSLLDRPCNEDGEQRLEDL